MNSAPDQIPATHVPHATDVLRARWRRPLKWFLVTVGTLVVLVAALLGAFGLVVGRVPEYRIQVQDWLSERTGLVVEFRALSARLRLVGPELVFDDAVVRTPDRTHVLAAARRGSVGFDIWSSLRNGQLSAGRFWLDSPQISLLRTREGRIQLLGQSALAGRADAKPIAVAQLPTGRFEVTDAVVHFRDEVTGRGPWSMSGVSFDLTRDIGAIRLDGEASLPATLGRNLTFSGSATGGLQDPHAVVSTFEISGEELDLSGWADVFPDEWPAPETGRGSIAIAGSLRGPALMQISAKVDFKKISTALPMWSLPLPAAAPMKFEGDDPHEDAVGGDIEKNDAAERGRPDTPETPSAIAEMVSYERMALSVSAMRAGDEWTASVTDLEFSRAGRPWRAERIEAKWLHGTDAIDALVKADTIDLGNTWPLLAYLPESENLARLRALRASGTFKDLSLTLQRPVADSAFAYVVQASLHDVAFAPVERAPGLSGVSGQLRAEQGGGELRLDSEDFVFELPRMFRDVLSARSAAGEIDWAIDDSGITVRGTRLQVRGDDGAANAEARVFVPRDRSSPILQITARGENLQVAATGRYVPGHRLRTKTLEWFDRAFVGGTIAAATFEMEGPLRVFPFRNDEGTFKAAADVENATLAYHEAWEPATGIEARIEFHNESMVARANSLQVGALQSTKASATIDDFKDSELQLEAVASGDLHAALQFLKDSPLAEAMGPQLAALDGQGALTAQLNLFLPIKRMSDRDVEVVARIEDGTIKHRELDAPVAALEGSLTVRNTLVTAADLTGRWLNGPLQISVRPQNRTRSILQASGRATAAQLKPLLSLPENLAMSGAADWRMTTALASGQSGQDDGLNLHLAADLRDFGFELPRPVGKLEGEPRRLGVDINIDNARSRALARVSLGNVRALLRLRQADGEWSLDRGGLRADGLAASLPSHRGLRIEGEIDRLVLDDWLALRDEPGEGKPLSDYLQAANVKVDSFELFGYRWRDVRGILQATPSGWRVDVGGPDAQGQIIIPVSFSGSVPLRATMDRFVLTKSDRERTEQDNSPLDPRRIPPLDVHVLDLRVGERTIGAIDLEASRAPRGLRFERMDISGVSVRAEGRGDWLAAATGSGSHASLTATVASEDVAATLSALHYTPILEAERGEIKAQLQWPGGYDGNILERASGSISVRAEAGQIVNVQPGAGRVLGLFSVAALPRRLALDFSDLTEKGLAFDSIHGDFELRGGDAFTNNLLLRGPAAEIGIAGRTGFGARDYDQTAIVTGNLGASLPVAGALAGGPAVGAALLLFSQVFKEPLRGMTRGYYRITGPWDNPSVERIEASDAKDATARATHSPAAHQ